MVYVWCGWVASQRSQQDDDDDDDGDAYLWDHREGVRCPFVPVGRHVPVVDPFLDVVMVPQDGVHDVANRPFVHMLRETA